MRESTEAGGRGGAAPAQGLGCLLAPDGAEEVTDLVILRGLDTDEGEVEVLVTLGLVTLVPGAQ